MRAGEAEVVREIESAGFLLLSRDHTIGINYALRFRRSKRDHAVGSSRCAWLAQMSTGSRREHMADPDGPGADGPGRII